MSRSIIFVFILLNFITTNATYVAKKIPNSNDAVTKLPVTKRPRRAVTKRPSMKNIKPSYKPSSKPGYSSLKPTYKPRRKPTRVPTLSPSMKTTYLQISRYLSSDSSCSNIPEVIDIIEVDVCMKSEDITTSSMHWIKYEFNLDANQKGKYIDI